MDFLVRQSLLIFMSQCSFLKIRLKYSKEWLLYKSSQLVVVDVFMDFQIKLTARYSVRECTSSRNVNFWVFIKNLVSIYRVLKISMGIYETNYVEKLLKHFLITSSFDFQLSRGNFLRKYKEKVMSRISNLFSSIKWSMKMRVWDIKTLCLENVMFLVDRTFW